MRKRLSAIKQYSTLGSGFKIAMRDLEIRGAGNLLGAEQSGHITAVGFELYCQLLKQSVASLKGEKVKARVEVLVRFDFLTFGPGEAAPALPPLAPPRVDVDDFDVVPSSTLPASPAPPSSPSLTPAHIPFDYIADTRQRLEIYRKLAQATEKTELAELEKALRDRFGPLPRPLQLLLEVAALKILAAERNVNLVEVKETKLMLTRNNDYIMVGGKIPSPGQTDPLGPDQRDQKGASGPVIILSILIGLAKIRECRRLRATATCLRLGSARVTGQ